MSLTAKTLNEAEFFYGHKACAGCGGSLAVRIALKVLVVLFALSSVGFTIRAGHLGAKLVWDSELTESTK